jgi:DNA primase
MKGDLSVILVRDPHSAFRNKNMPLYSDSILDEVRNSINIVTLVSEYVALKKRGRNWEARCPFHNEKTPSFKVSEEKQIFMCFGCHVGGDALKFIMLIERLTFPEAVRLLAERMGIQLPRASETPAHTEGLSPELLRQAISEAAELYHSALLGSGEGSKPLAYLLDRGVTRETISRFKLGYSPTGNDWLLQQMQRKGYSPQVLEECGLVKRSEDGRIYEYFRGRIMFPITDIRGRIIAFGGRTMEDRPPKYLNSPEGKLYNKSRNLFGLSFSRDGIKKLDHAILVEGYMDFIIPFQHGIDNLVASLGTSLTQQQVQLLGRYTRNVVVSYDPDSAGVAAAQRSLDLFLEEDFQVRVLRLPEGKDPDAVVRSEGSSGYRARVNDSISYLDFVFENAASSRQSLDNPRNKVQVLNAILPYLAKLPNAVERSEYVSRFARKLRVEDQVLLAELKRAAKQRSPRLREAPLSSVGAMKFAEKRLLQALLNNTVLQPEILPQFLRQDLENLAAERIFTALLDGFRRGEIATFESLHRQFGGEPEQALLAQIQMEDVPEDLSRESAQSFYNTLHSIRLASYKQQILLKIDEAAQRHDNELLNQLYEQRILVDRELVSLSRK